MPYSSLYPPPLVQCHIFIETPHRLEKLSETEWAELSLAVRNVSSSVSNVTSLWEDL